MLRQLPIFYNAILLTLVNLFLRLAGTGFQIYVSRQIGASGVGLLQLVTSVNALALVAGIAGVRTTSMYLTAEAVGRREQESAAISGCFLYSILCSCLVSLLLYYFAPIIASDWICNSKTTPALRLFAAFLPVICLCGVLAGYFTAKNRISMLAAVEIGEQIVSMAVTVAALFLWSQNDAARACTCVILGNCIAAAFALVILTALYSKEKPSSTTPMPLYGRLSETAVPLAIADVFKSGINTAENLMVPRRLALHIHTAAPLAAFGIISGMVFPILMFPACILFGLAELLIPELARCKASGSSQRISYLVLKSLRITLLYSLLFAGLEFLLAQELCQCLYQNPEAGTALKLYATLLPLLYCDAITDAMIKGLGQQKICVRYNILTSAMDILFLYYLLPGHGMLGYYFSFFITHAVNFLLSLRRLLRIAGENISCKQPVLSILAGTASICGASLFPSPAAKAAVFCTLFASLLCLLQITGREDLIWLKGLLCKKQPSGKISGGSHKSN